MAAGDPQLIASGEAPPCHTRKELNEPGTQRPPHSP